MCAKTRPVPSSTSTPLQSPGMPGAPPSNIFKMQKGRHIKKSYVDVLNPRGAPPAAPLAPPPAPGRRAAELLHSRPHAALGPE
ncbi:jg9948 [Pararge aegeria aegeria]|uniref:Jg9948 protein n=1 Tax=Pararge aegeria aegeria TaxID=348720 RepID=A0A8S4SG35_9NEOP|nr:jg9948 [Pararge aegeria aegeria]